MGLMCSWGACRSCLQDMCRRMGRLGPVKRAGGNSLSRGRDRPAGGVEGRVLVFIHLSLSS